VARITGIRGFVEQVDSWGVEGEKDGGEW
jgi:hypothetical protein